MQALEDDSKLFKVGISYDFHAFQAGNKAE